MATRKEERERLREIRREAEKREAREQRRKLVLGYAAAGILGAAVIVGIVVVIMSGGGGASGAGHINAVTGNTNGVTPDDRTGTPPPPLKVLDVKTAAKRAGCVLRLHIKDEGHKHVSTSVKYGTNPPTSGNHNPVPQADGAYLKTPPTTSIVHSLEHGRMATQYDPGLSPKDQLALKGLYDTEYAGALIFPNAKMPYAVAATTWTNMLGCKTYKGAITLDAIRDFGRVTWGRYGGEPVDGFGPLNGPTPANPS